MKPNTLERVALLLPLKGRRDGECLVWTGSTDRDGYGSIKLEGREVKVHRVSLHLSGVMEDLRDPRLVLHHCDNPPCFEPSHLYLGTSWDNVLDAIEAGTHSGLKWKGAENVTESDLSKKIAARIRKRGGWARKIAGGPSSAGLPDIVACYRGYGIWIETKLPGKERTLTKLQRATLDAIKSAGGIAVMVTSVKEVERIMDRIDQIKDKT